MPVKSNDNCTCSLIRIYIVCQYVCSPVCNIGHVQIRRWKKVYFRDLDVKGLNLQNSPNFFLTFSSFLPCSGTPIASALTTIKDGTVVNIKTRPAHTNTTSIFLVVINFEKVTVSLVSAKILCLFLRYCNPLKRVKSVTYICTGRTLRKGVFGTNAKKQKAPCAVSVQRLYYLHTESLDSEEHTTEEWNSD